MKPYEIIEHTADVGLKANGQSLSEAFSNIAKGMFDLITDESKVKDHDRYEINLAAFDMEQLLVDWLSELLFLHETEQVVFGRFDVTIDPRKHSISAMVFGEPFDSSKHRVGMQIKAVTYHMLEVRLGPPYTVQVIFDI
jgi:SHS2 domain-containing protein